MNTQMIWIGHTEPEKRQGTATFTIADKVFGPVELDSFTTANTLHKAIEEAYSQGKKSGINEVKDRIEKDLKNYY